MQENLLNIAEIECPICYNQYSEYIFQYYPIILNCCGNTICQKCIDEIAKEIEKGEFQFKCPKCQKEQNLRVKKARDFFKKNLDFVKLLVQHQNIIKQLFDSEAPKDYLNMCLDIKKHAGQQVQYFHASQIKLHQDCNKNLILKHDQVGTLKFHKNIMTAAEFKIKMKQNIDLTLEKIKKNYYNYIDSIVNGIMNMKTQKDYGNLVLDLNGFNKWPLDKEVVYSQEEKIINLYFQDLVFQKNLKLFEEKFNLQNLENFSNNLISCSLRKAEYLSHCFDVKITKYQHTIEQLDQADHTMLYYVLNKDLQLPDTQNFCKIVKKIYKCYKENKLKKSLNFVDNTSLYKLDDFNKDKFKTQLKECLNLNNLQSSIYDAWRNTEMYCKLQTDSPNIYTNISFDFSIDERKYEKLSDRITLQANRLFFYLIFTN